MCGIFIVINKKSEGLDLNKCKKSLNAMHRRGPDWSFYKVLKSNIFIGQEEADGSWKTVCKE